MTPKAKIIVAAVALLTAYAFGRYSAPTKIKTVTQTVEVEKKVDQTQTDAERNRRRETTTTKETHPDGTTTETTHTVEETETHKETDKSTTDDLTKSTTQEKEITRDSSKVTIAALGGIRVTSLSSPPVYGGQVYRPILGPIGLGVGAFTDGTVFFSVGLSF